MEQEVEESSLRNLICSLNENMDNNFAKIHEELSGLCLEMKHEIDKLNSKFKELEKGIEELWATIEDLKEESAVLKAVKILQENETQLLKQELEKVNLELANT